MRKDESTEKAVKQLVRKIGKAADELYSKLEIADPEAIIELEKISRAVSDLAQIALWQSGLRKEYEKEYL